MTKISEIYKLLVLPLDQEFPGKTALALEVAQAVATLEAFFTARFLDPPTEGPCPLAPSHTLLHL